MSAATDWLSERLLARVAALGSRELEPARRRTAWLRRLLQLALRRRRRIVHRNLELCFPELDRAARQQLEREHFGQLADAVAEIAYAWHHPGRLDTAIGEVRGQEHLDTAREPGHGVLLVTAHCTCLELGARLFGERFQARALYRPLANARLDAAQCTGRARYAEAMIPRHDLRAMLRHLRGGGIVWYAPDQDLGPDRSTFAPFFGIETATANAIAELARRSRARVVPMYPLKNPETGRITVWLEPAWNDFPSDDRRADLARYNAFVERRVREHPAQYWWLHRRFKTAPEGEPPRYRN
ncbi:MAG: lysophospholipid acyltransferase family protein [Wenzhouxiangellaceae bacterium]|nr:lysophospholipid acyltransferase family protein [Wenzhouxiangellaceae bacterium]